MCASRTGLIHGNNKHITHFVVNDYHRRYFKLGHLTDVMTVE